MKKPQRTLICAGFGYSARYLADLLRGDGVQIMATARSSEQAGTLAQQGVTPLRIDTADRIEVPEHADWLISAPPGAEGCPIHRLLSDQAVMARWIGYLSTTGVYGDRQGNWVFEWSAVSPDSERGRRRVLAEQQWLATGGPVHVFRLPGIYGPGRSAFDRLKDGSARRIIKPGQVFSRVHVEDIASCLAASLAQPNPGRVYHPCDDDAAPPQDVIAFAADLMGVEIPPDIPFDTADLSPMAQSFYAECKRVSNARTKSELGWLPKYPNYRDGLRAILNP